MGWFKIVKGVGQGFILSPCLFNLRVEYTMWNAGLDDSQTGLMISHKLESWLTKRNNNFRYGDDTTLMAEIEEELESFLMRVKEESEKTGLKLSIHKTKIMAYSLITSWQIDGGKLKTVADFIFLGSKITVDSDCHHRIKRCLLLGKKKAMKNLDSTLKRRYINLPTKVHIVKAMVSPVLIYVVSIGP